ncbi:protein of unknown function [Caminicella sporogenes DSM 14501]|uniref:DUF4330 domain-containing protein n=1 Tax=Caminicella sporogenes DSM 14501 TaxID=1121266 RepID=A0A1M6QH71_9FIRM|nr:DUF4330 domain-containing protein [Caminicella sporogenes]RKD25319.1 hypothetical protein BET04_03660 [Caminicella sporogenes]SHK19387.1 protein of unknown function [Caminicella sporogenes DSM 14501]
MRFVDDKGRLFGTVNLFDLLVILLIFALIGGAAYKFIYLDNKVALSESDITVTLWIEDVRKVTVDTINVGDVVREYDSNLLFGTIVDKEVKPHYEEVETSDGRVVNAKVDGKYDVYITLKCRGIVSDNAISIASKEVKIGGKIILKHKLYAVSTRAVKIITE